MLTCRQQNVNKTTNSADYREKKVFILYCHSIKSVYKKFNQQNQYNINSKKLPSDWKSPEDKQKFGWYLDTYLKLHDGNGDYLQKKYAITIIIDFEKST